MRLGSELGWLSNEELIERGIFLSYDDYVDENREALEENRKLLEEKWYQKSIELSGKSFGQGVVNIPAALDIAALKK